MNAIVHDDTALVDRALTGDRTAFETLVSPYQRELHVHCYRMVGSLHDAEDLTQETMLRAWRALRSYRGKGPVRAWLYKIATNACLNHIRSRPRLVVPHDAAATTGAVPAEVEVPWLEPYPDRVLEMPDAGIDPAEGALARARTSLAFLRAVQLLPPLQRAVLILRDVLEFSAKEVASFLDTTPTAVNSALQRARARLSPEIRTEPPFAERAPAPEEEMIVRRFMRAWEARDIEGLVGLLAEDAILAMPPAPLWFRGRAAIGEFLGRVPAEGRLDLIPLKRVHANGQHAVAAYMPNEETRQVEGYGIMVLTINFGEITRITGFADPDLFRLFELPRTT